MMEDCMCVCEEGRSDSKIGRFSSQVEGGGLLRILSESAGCNTEDLEELRPGYRGMESGSSVCGVLMVGGGTCGSDVATGLTPLLMRSVTAHSTRCCPL
ncbi:hypothetical protein CgunFtcFv8_007546 [Champsocephalus gunnari]|uniref:Uncharacterized protein n=1 Tax=Champsocephalus gunnari TaxID=52237 RepID=A0AAN8CGN2_CHAGU|nr:hypothetical protein CgunFtcFv8_007546 [Champsocephalus gunnari]